MLDAVPERHVEQHGGFGAVEGVGYFLGGWVVVVVHFCFGWYWGWAVGSREEYDDDDDDDGRDGVRLRV